MSEESILFIGLFCLGAIFGSFSNVVIYRLPQGQSVVYPGSRCRSCGRPVRWFHNIPIFSWFALRGKCADCGSSIAFRYPMVELAMALLFAMAGWRFGYSWTLVEALIFIFGLVTCSVIDIDHMILPDKFTLPGIVIGLVGAALNPERSFSEALYGAVLGFGFLWSVAYLYYAFRGREGMGGGDIKLLGWIGAVLGWHSLPVVILLSSVIGSIVGIALAIRTKDGMQQAIPFGPYLASAAMVYMFFQGEGLSSIYLSFFGL